MRDEHAQQLEIVAPFTGAWIEIKGIGNHGRCIGCRTLHGCVD